MYVVFAIYTILLWQIFMYMPKNITENNKKIYDNKIKYLEIILRVFIFIQSSTISDISGKGNNLRLGKMMSVSFKDSYPSHVVSSRSYLIFY